MVSLARPDGPRLGVDFPLVLKVVRMRFLCCVAAALLLWCGGNAWAQNAEMPSVLEGRPDAETGASTTGAQLGRVFESKSAGIAFRGPSDSQEIRRSGGDEIVQYVNEPKKWQLSVSRVELREPLPLTNQRDAAGRSHPGLLDMTVNQIRIDKAGSEILRDDVIRVGDVEVGMIAARYSIRLETHLLQQALVKAGDRSYFVFTFTTPAPRTGELSEDPGVREAVETFTAMVDTIRLLDQTGIKQDQNERLFRTRALFLSMSEPRLRNALIQEQWLRLMRDGKDIGYAYVVEEVASDLPNKSAPRRPSSAHGVRIGMRSRMIPETGVQVDAESWMWMSFDRRHEQWSSAAIVKRGQEQDYISEFGAADRSSIAELRGEEHYVLHATHITKSASAEPVERQLPVFYIPQALGHLLPRMLPRFEQKGYMFATYVSDKREVMSRYVDVGREEEVTLGGARVRAIPIRDRLGLEGTVTTHYISPEGAYLGSVNAGSKITLLPTDRKTIESLWKDADLTRPADVEDRVLPTGRSGR
jgi:hypothetical protein